MEASTKAIDVASQDDMSVRHVDRLSELGSEKFLKVLRSALVGDPPGKVLSVTRRRKPGTGMVRARSGGYFVGKTAWFT